MAFFAKNKKDATIQNNSAKRKLKEIFYLSMEYDKTRQSFGSPVHGIVTKAVQKNSSRGGGG